jgi:adenine-specific DNA methylase
VRCANVADAPLEPGSVDLVLTDPPYFDCLQYGQLADFHHAWLRRLADPGDHPDTPTTISDRDAVGGENVDLQEFAVRLSEVYVAAAEALKDGGAFCFTYHHNTLDAYAPVVMACLDAGLAVSAGYACPTEMRASLHNAGRAAATVDGVFVLHKSQVASARSASFGRRWVKARLAALHNADVKVTDADRACVRHCAKALAAMCVLRDTWDSDAPAQHRYATARAALGLPATVATPTVDILG